MKHIATPIFIVALAAAALLFFSNAACGAETEYVDNGVRYSRYINTRYGFSIPYPSELLIPQPPPSNNDGREFLSHDKQSQMSAWGTFNIMEETLAGRMASEKSDPDRTVTYEATQNDWFVISGYIDGRIFYIRTYLVDDIFYTFYIVYDETLSDIFNPITAHISGEFRVPGAME
ncbi:MAG: hypothetical protein JW885_11495 [Deltaproteobacteria bacterium]|nr:hypothetical protein [Candidatus Zymogenaceae bacterium]